MKTSNLTGVLFLGGKEHVIIEIAACVYAQQKEKFSSRLKIILGKLKIKPKRILKQTTFRFLSVNMKYF